MWRDDNVSRQLIVYPINVLFMQHSTFHYHCNPSVCNVSNKCQEEYYEQLTVNLWEMATAISDVTDMRSTPLKPKLVFIVR